MLYAMLMGLAEPPLCTLVCRETGVNHSFSVLCSVCVFVLLMSCDMFWEYNNFCHNFVVSVMEPLGRL